MTFSTECSICGEATKVKHCTTCAESYCLPCSNFVHKGVKSAHAFIIEWKETDLLPSKHIKCWRHKNEYVKSYCLDCNLVVCHCCALLHHEDHAMQPIDIVVSNHGIDLKSRREYIITQVSEVETVKTQWDTAFVEYEKLLEQNFAARRERSKKILIDNCTELKSVYNNIIIVKVDKNIPEEELNFRERFRFPKVRYSNASVGGFIQELRATTAPMSLYHVDQESEWFKLYIEALCNRSKDNLYALTCIDRAISINNVDLSCLLLKCELSGSGSFESINVYRFIASQKPYDHYDEYAIGEALIQSGKKEEGLSMIRSSARQGNMIALHRLGNLTFNGDTYLGFSTNKTEGIKLFKESAQYGFALAFYNLGYCYFAGDGIAKDRNEGFNYYKKAALLGCAIAEHKLGNCYENGTGTEENLTEARKFYEIASFKGYDPSTRALEALLERIAQEDDDTDDGITHSVDNQ